jgi:hypothetical protein
MGRDIPFDPELECDICGRKGSFDLMGDFICEECFEEEEKEQWDS